MAHLLVVEDEVAILQQMAALLQRTKHTVFTASDGLEALKLLGVDGAEMSRPDVVILDIMMPNANGYAVARKMAESPHTKDIPLIVLTGYTDLEDVFHKFKSVAAFLPKPLDPPKLLNTLADVLASRRSGAA